MTTANGRTTDPNNLMAAEGRSTSACGPVGGALVGPEASEPLSAEPYSSQPYSVEPYSVEPYSVEPYSVEPYSVEPYSAEFSSAELSSAGGTSVKCDLIAGHVVSGSSSSERAELSFVAGGAVALALHNRRTTQKPVAKRSGGKAAVGGVATFRLQLGDEEFSACEIRKILQRLFPQRKLALSQLTFFNHAGVARPTGTTFRRKRRCYRLMDILPVACVLALKEQGIPLKNIDGVPGLLQEHAEAIVSAGNGCRMLGCESSISLLLPRREAERPLEVIIGDGMSPLNRMLERLGLPNGEQRGLFWSFDVGSLAEQLFHAAEQEMSDADGALTRSTARQFA